MVNGVEHASFGDPFDLCLRRPAQFQSHGWIARRGGVEGNVNAAAIALPRLDFEVAQLEDAYRIPLGEMQNEVKVAQYAQFNEVSQPPDYTQQVVTLIGILSENPIYAPESIAVLCDWGITHVYHGQGQGQVGYNVSPLYLPKDLRAAPDLFTQIYHQDRVSIFVINPNTCSNQP